MKVCNCHIVISFWHWCINDGIVEVGDMCALCDIVPAGVGVHVDGERCIRGSAGTPPAIPTSQHHLLIVTINCFISILVHNCTTSAYQKFKTGIYWLSCIIKIKLTNAVSLCSKCLWSILLLHLRFNCQLSMKTDFVTWRCLCILFLISFYIKG